MRDCESFQQRFTGAVPERYWGYAKNTLRSFHESCAMLGVFRHALKTAPPPALGSRSVSVAAFGSFGRLDGALAISDFDALYICKEPLGIVTKGKIRSYIASVISGNRGLLFDHRDQIEDGGFDWESSRAYPLASEEEIDAEEGGNRALQLLTESRCVVGSESLSVLRTSLLERFGYPARDGTLDCEILSEALGAQNRQFLESLRGAADAGTPPSNRKLLKLFALREFYYLATLMALAEVSLAVELGRAEKSEALRRLSSPSVLKAVSFAHPANVFFATLALNSLGGQERIQSLLREQVNSLDEAFTRQIMEEDARPGRPASTTTTLMRILSLNVLRTYDKIIGRLHDVRFLEVIDTYGADILTWITNDHCRGILSLRNDLVASLQLVASALIEVIEYCSHTPMGSIGAGAKSVLEQVKGYTIHGRGTI